MKKAILLGAGGFSREILETVDFINRHSDEQIEPVGYVYDGGEKEKGKSIHNYPVLGDISFLQSIDTNELYLIAAAGRSIWRKQMVQKAREYGGKFLSVIHPTSIVSKWAVIGEGAVIQAFCTVNPGAVIGDFFTSNRSVGIGHDTTIGDYVHINPNVNISGGTVIGNEVFIGVKATILTSNIGDGAVIGACALVTKDVPSHVLAKGIPAKYFDIHEKHY